MNEGPENYFLDQLTIHAALIDAINTPDPVATVKYDFGSGALIWSDELNSELPEGAIDALKCLLQYRTQLMLNAREPDEETWAKIASFFPNWIGLLSERRFATPELLAEYRRGDITGRWWLRCNERDDQAAAEQCA